MDQLNPLKPTLTSQPKALWIFPGFVSWRCRAIVVLSFEERVFGIFLAVKKGKVKDAESAYRGVVLIDRQSIEDLIPE